MPKGVPKNGFRMTKNRVKSGFIPSGLAMVARNSAVEVIAPPIATVSHETDDQIRTRLTASFAAMNKIAEATILGANKALIISGPAGVGKSHDVFGLAQKYDDKGRKVTIIKGFVRATGLYKTLYENRHKKCTVVFDDADSIFSDDVSLNLLKGACDMTRTRKLHWLAETRMEDESGEKLPTSFEFEGSIVFITNYDFDYLIEKGNKLSEHFRAMVSRSMYLDLDIKSVRDYLVRIQMAMGTGMLDDLKITKDVGQEIYNFIESNLNQMRELSIRMFVKLASIRNMDGNDWQNLARATCFKQQVRV